jgi:hypothetical protein
MTTQTKATSKKQRQQAKNEGNKQKTEATSKKQRQQPKTKATTENEGDNQKTKATTYRSLVGGGGFAGGFEAFCE